MNVEFEEFVSSFLKKYQSEYPSELERLKFAIRFERRYTDPFSVLMLSIAFGSFGVDRFYIGNKGLGFGKLCTLGGLGVWTVIDWFLILKATGRRNSMVAQQIHDSLNP